MPESHPARSATRSAGPFRRAELTLPGCFLISATRRGDDRGWFLKTFQRSAFSELGLHGDFREAFVTSSDAGVLRGMHLQRPPSAQAKTVACWSGAVHDVLLDLREDSPTYGKWHAHVLSDRSAEILYVPPGVAHGFFVLEAPALMHYAVSAEYDPVHDVGVRWDSAGIEWPAGTPRISARDAALPPLGAFPPMRVPDHAAHP